MEERTDREGLTERTIEREREVERKRQRPAGEKNREKSGDGLIKGGNKIENKEGLRSEGE